MSAFIILVFSRQKGLTLVFRNDPLESLKVSSTFDSIPFVRDYLQKEIEGQLRTLLMDELPAIIHRLSLRLWVPEYRAKEDAELAQNAQHPSEEQPVDPLASPPQDPVDLSGNTIDPSHISRHWHRDAFSVLPEKSSSSCCPHGLPPNLVTLHTRHQRRCIQGMGWSVRTRRIPNPLYPRHV